MQNTVLALLRKLSFTSILLVCITVEASGQQIDYPAVFGKDWERANTFLKENRTWMELILRKNHIPYKLAAAIVFPELVRYSALRDKMEITLLKALYINLGEDYANFSVGHFQIKPSFAALVSERLKDLPGRRSGLKLSDPSQYEDISDYRKSLLAELEDPGTELGYVVAFIKVCEKKFDLPDDEESRVRFLSSAYNCGIERDELEILEFAGKRFFSTSLFGTANTWSYSDISLYWYRNN